MAFNVTHSNQAYSQANSGALTIDKPASLAVGDLMVAHVMMYRNVNWTSGMPSGWTLLRQNAGDNNAPYPAMMVAYKIADSGDVAASNFTFTANVTDTAVKNGYITRITGQKATSPVGVNSGTANSKTAGTITPADANSLIMIFAGNGGGESIGNTFAIATDNPASWTQEYTASGGGGGRVSMGYALRPQTTATGNGSWTSASGENSTIMVAIYPLPNTDYTKGLTETITLVETQLHQAGKLLLETIALNEIFSRVSTAIRSLTETVTLVDTVDTTKIAIQQFTEVITLVETTAAKLTARVLLETIALVDTVTTLATMFRGFVETITLVDTIAAIRSYVRSLTETITLVEANIVRATSKTFIEVVSMVETFISATNYNKSFSETVTLVDTQTLVHIYNLVLTEIVTLVDTITRATAFILHLIENITITARFRGLINGRDIAYIKKYVNQAGTYIKKYLDLP